MTETAPAKAAPMREDVTPLIMMLRAATVEEGCAVFEHSPEEIGLAVIEAHNEVLARLAHTARPDAGDEDALIELGVRAAYDDWPQKVISEALAEATGLPSGAKIDYDMAIRLGMDVSGLRRTVRAALLATRLVPIVRPAAADEDVERVARAILDRHGVTVANYGGMATRGSVLPGAAVLASVIAAMREGVDRGMVERLRDGLMMEVVDAGRWSLRFDFGKGDDACRKLRLAADAVRAALSLEQPR